MENETEEKLGNNGEPIRNLNPEPPEDEPVDDWKEKNGFTYGD